VKDLWRKHGVSEKTFFRWKSKYGGMDVSEARWVCQLEDENARQKRMVADISLDPQALKELANRSGDAQRSTSSGDLPPRDRRAGGVATCRMVAPPRATQRFRLTRLEGPELRQRLVALTNER
jgi:putative transposase